MTYPYLTAPDADRVRTLWYCPRHSDTFRGKGTQEFEAAKRTGCSSCKAEKETSNANNP